MNIPKFQYTGASSLKFREAETGGAKFTNMEPEIAVIRDGTLLLSCRVAADSNHAIRVGPVFGGDLPRPTIESAPFDITNGRRFNVPNVNGEPDDMSVRGFVQLRDGRFAVALEDWYNVSAVPYPSIMLSDGAQSWGPWTVTDIPANYPGRGLIEMPDELKPVWGDLLTGDGIRQGAAAASWGMGMASVSLDDATPQHGTIPGQQRTDWDQSHRMIIPKWHDTDERFWTAADYDFLRTLNQPEPDANTLAAVDRQQVWSGRNGWKQMSRNVKFGGAFYMSAEQLFCCVINQGLYPIDYYENSGLGKMFPDRHRHEGLGYSTPNSTGPTESPVEVIAVFFRAADVLASQRPVPIAAQRLHTLPTVNNEPTRVRVAWDDESRVLYMTQNKIAALGKYKEPGVLKFTASSTMAAPDPQLPMPVSSPLDMPIPDGWAAPQMAYFSDKANGDGTYTVRYQVVNAATVSVASDDLDLIDLPPKGEFVASPTVTTWYDVTGYNPTYPDGLLVGTDKIKVSGSSSPPPTPPPPPVEPPVPDVLKEETPAFKGIKLTGGMYTLRLDGSVLGGQHSQFKEAIERAEALVIDGVDGLIIDREPIRVERK